MNPSVPDHVLARAFQEDPISAASEYGQDGHVVFRRDVEGFLDRDAVRAVTIPDRRELTPIDGIRYTAFVDPSGGSVDSMTLAVAHREGSKAILDLLRERRPLFSPDDVVREFVEALAPYGIGYVIGDRYAGAWVRERFLTHAVGYESSQRTKSDLYRELLPAVNAARVELLEHHRLETQLVGLERRVSRGGRETIEHAPGGHDDVANAAAGALVLAAEGLPSAPRDPMDDEPLSAWDPEVLAHEAREQRRVKRSKSVCGYPPEAF